MQEQNRFNAEEAEKARQWQEMMYRMFGTSSAKVNDMRAAGLNALLGEVSASGNVGSGATASAAESAQMMPTDYSFVGDAATHGLAAYNTTRSVDRLFLCRNLKRTLINLLKVSIMLRKVFLSLRLVCKN